jgi:amino acid adenylation domain-containing protein
MKNVLVHQLFEQQAEKYPGKIAIREEEREISYLSLNEQANYIARLLYAIGAGKDTVIAYLGNSGINLVSSLLGIFKAGGIYLPVDTSFPAVRIRSMLDETNCKIGIVSKNEQATFLTGSSGWKDGLQYLLLLDGNGQLETTFLKQVNNEWITAESPVINFRGNPNYEVTEEYSNYIFYTSGSTGTGKPILGWHKGLSHFIDWETREFELDENVRVSQLTRITFDASLRDIFLPLTNGGTLYVPSEKTRSNVIRIQEWLEENSISVVHIVPSVFRLLNKEMKQSGNKNARRFPALKHILMAGEPLYVKDINAWREHVGHHTELVNLYGTSETTMAKTFHRIKEVAADPGQMIHTGKPIDGAFIAIVNNGELCSIGEIGEIYIKTPYRTKGYYNNETLTNRFFVQNPLQNTETDIVHKTGDMGRYLSDRSVEVLGRSDDQVKVNGIRLQLSDVEQCMLGCEGVEEAVVLIHKNRDQDNELIGYYTGEKVSKETLREYMVAQIGETIVPGYLVQLDEFPLSTNGKINKKELPRPNELIISNEDYEAVWPGVETDIENMWKELLGLERIGRKLSFFEIGGNSLKAIQLISKIYKKYHVLVKINEIFACSSIQQLAAHIQQTIEPAKEIPSLPAKQGTVLSQQQRRLWILNQLDETPVAYNIQGSYVLEGKLDRENLSSAFNELIKRNEILRTRFTEVEGEPFQQVMEAGISCFTMISEDLTKENNQEERIAVIAAKDSQTPFDLENGPLLRCRLLQLSEDSHLLLVNMHNIISDNWSADLLIKEVGRLYNSYYNRDTVHIPAPAMQYSDFSAKQQEELFSESMHEHSTYWKEQFKETAPVLALATDYTRPATKTYNCKVVKGRLDYKVSQAIHLLSTVSNCSVFISLLSALKALLYRYTGQEDIVVGTQVPGREHSELREQIGCYANTLALRTRFSGEESFDSLLEHVRSTTLNAYSHQQYPFDLLLEKLDMVRDMSRCPLFDVLVVMQDSEENIKEWVGNEVIKVSHKKTDPVVSRFDIIIHFLDEGTEGISMEIQYREDLYSHERMQRMLDHYSGIWEAILADTKCPVNRMEYLSGNETKQLIGRFNNTDARYPADKTLQAIFEQRVEENRDAIAVMFEGSELTYGQLNDKANQLAHYLRRQHGIERESMVGLMVERSEWMIVGILGILKAGAAYVPVDPEHPADRKTYLLNDAAVQLLLTDSEAVDTGNFLGEKIYIHTDWDRLIAAMPVSNPLPVNQATDAAYVIYTSGSSGLPKGVLIEHYNVVRLLFNEQHPFSFTVNDTWTVFHSICFDLSVWEIFGGLLYGAKLLVITQETAQTARLFANKIKEEKVTVLTQVPGVFSNVMNELLEQKSEKGLSLRYIVFGGEALNPASLKTFNEHFPATSLVNMYGITETTVHTTFKEIREAEINAGDSNIGVPLPTVKLYLCDKNGNLVPDGIAGEILVGGMGLARGYLNRPELTAEKFTKNPWKEGERIYRSGDMGRRIGNGELIYMSRIDFQVKVRGYRIELGEIEDAMLRCEGVREAVVKIYSDAKGEYYLAAYYAGNIAVTTSALRNWLRGILPGYMIPVYFKQLESLPLTLNGKTDRNALPAPSQDEKPSGYKAPCTSTEQKMKVIWEEVLNRSDIGIEDNFFDCGGHSLKAARIVARIYKKFEVKVELHSLFTHSTIEALSRLVDKAGEKGYENIRHTGKQVYHELSHGQKRFWAINQAETNKSSYNVPAAFEITGTLDIQILSKAIARLVERHEILRTRFTTIDGEPVQQVIPFEEGQFVEYIDLRNKADKENTVKDWISKVSYTEFDLEKGTLIRVVVLQTGNENYTYLFTMHHIICDGWSIEVLNREMLLLYNAILNNEVVNLQPLRIQYKEFAVWQNRENKTPAFESHRRYWLQHLSGFLPRINLPLDYPRPAEKKYDGKTISFFVEKEEKNKLQETAKQYDASLFMVSLALLNTLLYSYTKQEDFIIGSPVAGREHPDLENQVGLYINTILLRNQVKPGQGFDKLLQQVKENSVKALTHQSYPFDLLVDELEFEQTRGRNLLFDVGFTYFNEDIFQSGSEKTEQPFKVRELDHQFHDVKADMWFKIVEAADRLIVTITYSTLLFRPAFIDQLTEDFRLLIALVTSDASVSMKTIEKAVQHSHEEREKNKRVALKKHITGKLKALQLQK